MLSLDEKKLLAKILKKKPKEGDKKAAEPNDFPMPSPKKEKWISAGGVVLGGPDDLDHIWIRKPSNNYGPWSFAKGKVDKGETKEKAALREVKEEIGIVAEIIPGGYLGSFEGGYSHTHYYMMFAKRNLGRHDKETEKVMLATWTEAVHKFAKGGNNRDIQVLTRAMDQVEKMKRKMKK